MKRFLILGGLVLAGIANASTVILTFDPPPMFQEATSVTGLGVTFGFSVAGSCSDWSTACYGDMMGTSGMGLLTISDPVLDGPGDGILTLTFAQPSTLLSFDVVLGLTSGETHGVSVALSGPDYSGPPVLYGATNPQGIMELSAGSFSYNSGSVFTQATLTFANGSSTFAIDNLAFTTADVGVPEPGSWILAMSGVLLVGLSRIRRLAR